MANAALWIHHKLKSMWPKKQNTRGRPACLVMALGRREATGSWRYLRRGTRSAISLPRHRRWASCCCYPMLNMQKVRRAFRSHPGSATSCCSPARRTSHRPSPRSRRHRKHRGRKRHSVHGPSRYWAALPPGSAHPYSEVVSESAVATGVVTVLSNQDRDTSSRARHSRPSQFAAGVVVLYGRYLCGTHGVGRQDDASRLSCQKAAVVGTREL